MNSLGCLGFRGIQVRVNVDLTTLNILHEIVPPPIQMGWDQFLLNVKGHLSELSCVFASHVCMPEDDLGTG